MKFSLLIFILCHTFSSFSQYRPGDIDSTNKSQYFGFSNKSFAINPDKVMQLRQLNRSQIKFEVSYQRNGELLPIRDLKFKDASIDGDSYILNCDARTKVIAPLGISSFFQIKKSKNIYFLMSELECGYQYKLIFNEATYAGQAVSIYETAQRALSMLNQSVDISFWNQSVDIIWPSTGDYFNGSSLHITNGSHWDVVAHELGHFIYSAGKIGRSKGGSHRIDECYSDTLAFSEGWATFFAAWLYLSPMDNDAHFQYLVPRRAPVQIENVPSDVCRGTSNEWRNSSFLWDLIDGHDDQEQAYYSFSFLWDSLSGSKVSSVNQVKNILIQSGADKNIIDKAWNLNF